MQLSSPIHEVKGIGPKTELLYHKLGIYTVSDLLMYFPQRYIQYPEPVEMGLFQVGHIVAFRGHLVGRPSIYTGGRMPVVTCNISDGNIKIQMTWFRMPFMAKAVKVPYDQVFYGKIISKNGRFVMEQPRVFRIEQYEELRHALQPVYHLTQGLKNATVTKAVRSVLESGIWPKEALPEKARRKYSFPSQKDALSWIHFPSSTEELELARKKFSYEEFLLFLVGVRFQKMQLAKVPNSAKVSDFALQEKLVGELGFELTKGQRGALEDIRRDVSGSGCMQRLLQGDVGSGKTIIAFLSMASFAQAGYQSALMAPTEVLAQQHYESLCQFLDSHGLPFKALLLTGSMGQKEKKRNRELLKTDMPYLVVGTHALIQEGVEFSNLGLVVTDEQHRFGVRQRDSLSRKGIHPHILVMSATPIPRTLSLILYGDLDVSVMGDVPKSRLPIKNAVISPQMRTAAWKKIYKEIEAGHQAYVICPLVEESEGVDAEDAEGYYQKMRAAFPSNIRIGLLHGRMKPEEKNAAMEAFSKNETQVLVATTVIEVGINVPNATVMMIENAERFGLAQLHQIRGRVGRGASQSYCILVNGSGSEDAEKRLEIVRDSRDGFEIAQQDLKLRGPGEYFGDRQSGGLDFKVADIYQDEELLQEASKDAVRILKDDPRLEKESHAEIKKRVQEYMKQRGEIAGL